MKTSSLTSRGAVFGIVTRNTLSLYVRATILMMLIFLVMALAIDLAISFSEISSRSSSSGTSQSSILAPYVLYRSVDIVTRLLPQACFFGVFLAEIIRAQRFETNILYFAGISPAHSLVAVLWFGVLMGAVQTINESWARPAAVFSQIEMGVGTYAHRYKPGLKDSPDWFLRGNTVLRAVVKRGDPPELRDLELFTGIDQDRIGAVTLAKRAVPAGKPGRWRLSEVVVWTPEDTSKDYSPEFFASLDLDLNIEATRIKFWGIGEYYLRWADLRKIAATPTTIRSADADVAIWRRWSAILLPGAFAFLGASLAPLGFQGGRANVPVLVALAVFGYLSIVCVKVFWALGELGVITPEFAVFSPLVFASIVAGMALRKQQTKKWPVFIWTKRG